MEMPLASPPQDTHIKLYVKARWSKMCCLHCRWWWCQKQRLAAFFFQYTHTLDKRGTNFPFGGTPPILPRSHGVRWGCCTALCETQATAENTNKQLFTPRAPGTSTHSLALTRKGPDDWAWLSQEVTSLLCHQGSTHLLSKASNKAFSEISSLQLVPDTLGWLLFRAHRSASNTVAWQVPAKRGVYYQVSGLIYAVWVMIRVLKWILYQYKTFFKALCNF